MSYSDNPRRYLHAKRRNERPNGLAVPPMRWREPNNDDDIQIKRGIKRQMRSPTKNIANDRLKRLRAKLNEDAAKPRRSFQKVLAELQEKKRRSTSRRRSSLTPRRRSRSFSRSNVGVKKAKDSAICASTMPDIAEKIEPQQSSVAVNSHDVQIQIEEKDQGRNGIEWDRSLLEMLRVQPKPNNGRLYIVVDTNIFMSNLGLIKDLVDYNGKNKPLIYIPWMVNEELDYLKDDGVKGTARYQAQTAIKYINNALVNKKSRILGQTLDEFNEQKPCDKNPDNKILMCCLQLREKQKNFVLLSNDVNIRNKAILNGIGAFAHNQCAGFLKNDQSKAEKILDNFTELCSKVIACCAREAYGTNWNRLHLLSSKPQSTEDCIRIFKKYWFTVFQEHLLKQFNKAVDHLSSFLSKNERKLKDNSTQIGDLVRHCVRVCVYLKDVRAQKNAVEETIRTLNEIKGSH